MEILLIACGLVFLIAAGSLFQNILAETSAGVAHAQTRVLILSDHQPEKITPEADYQDIHDVQNLDGYDYYILLSDDDALNLATAKKGYGNVYACCHDRKFMNLYQKQNIRVITRHDLPSLIHRLNV